LYQTQETNAVDLSISAGLQELVGGGRGCLGTTIELENWTLLRWRLLAESAEDSLEDHAKLGRRPVTTMAM